MFRTRARTGSAVPESVLQTAVFSPRGEDCPSSPLARRLQVAVQADADGNGDLGLDEFRALHRKIHPDQPMTRRVWEETAAMFRLIDQDNSGQVSCAEVFEFLDRCADERRRLMARPASYADWCDVLFCHGTTRWLSHKEEPWLAAGVWLAKFFDFAVSLLLTVVLMVVSMKSNQAAHPHYEGTAATDALTWVGVVWLIVHTVGWTTARLYSAMPGAMDVTPCGVLMALPEHARTWKAAVKGLFWSRHCRSGYINLITLVGALVYAVQWLDAFWWVFPTMSVRMLACSGVLRLFGVSTPELMEPLRRGAYEMYVLCILMMVTVAVSGSMLLYFERQDAFFNFAKQQWVRSHNSDLADAGSPLAFQSLFDAAWWSVVTITTVGYGDKYPATVGGKFTGVLTMLASMVIVSYPITILNDTIAAVAQERAEVQERANRINNFHEAIVKYVMKLKTAATDAESAAGNPGTIDDPKADAVRAAFATLGADIDDRFAKLRCRMQPVAARLVE
eukprot:TRINITY_DN3147_c0_g5_i1.p1 TRINITY_DN3147_c0_g5~~TRINITY_DN3147_c0_g5_i1.p1  ORF type:complete len:506 (+),score=127.13 TRINITY_DN3147_c0_g5_i1:52-1569(+)